MTLAPIIPLSGGRRPRYGLSAETCRAAGVDGAHSRIRREAGCPAPASRDCRRRRRSSPDGGPPHLRGPPRRNRRGAGRGRPHRPSPGAAQFFFENRGHIPVEEFRLRKSLPAQIDPRAADRLPVPFDAEETPGPVPRKREKSPAPP